MKTYQLFLLSIACTLVSISGFAQEKTEKIKVAGECGMCKKKIENAAKAAGASTASWSVENKVLTVSYAGNASSTVRLEKAIAAAGYDTQNEKASEEAYNSLHECCKYDRTAAAKAMTCCDDSKCAGTACMKDGKCADDMSCCKNSGCDKKDCCKKS